MDRKMVVISVGDTVRIGNWSDVPVAWRGKLVKVEGIRKLEIEDDNLLSVTIDGIPRWLTVNQVLFPGETPSEGAWRGA